MTNREQQEKIFRAIGFVGDDLIQRADAPVERQSIHTAWIKWAALAACCALVIGLAAKLPLFQMKSASQAPEAASMNASAEGPEMKEELAEDTVTTEAAPAEAEEAPAEEKLQTGEMGASSGNDTAERIGTPYDAALKNTLLETTVGPVTLGMPASDVLSLLGEPLEKSDGYYVCTDKGEYFYAAWRYNFTNDPDVLDVILQMADVGNGLVLNEIMTEAVAMQQPPSDKGKRLRLYYITQVAVKPPTFVIFVNDKQLMHFSYTRYIENRIRDAFGFRGTSLKFIIRERKEG